MQEAKAHEISQFTTRLRAGQPQRTSALTLVPILDPEFVSPGAADADLLEEALRKGTEVTEITEGGVVNTIRVLHKGDKLLLLVDGEEIVGAKQNRVFNASFLVAPGQTVDLPVSCVEQGRWRYQNKSFSSAGRTLTGSARVAKMKRVNSSVTMHKSYDANQGAVWSDVQQYLGKTQVHSGTMAFADGAERRTQELSAELAALTPVPSQVGLAALDGGRLVSIDLFGSPALLARAYPKITRGLLLDVGEGGERPSNEAAREVVEAALRAAAAARVDSQPAPGAGQTLIVAAGGVAASGIAHGGKIYHCLIAPA